MRPIFVFDLPQNAGAEPSIQRHNLPKLRQPRPEDVFLPRLPILRRELLSRNKPRGQAQFTSLLHHIQPPPAGSTFFSDARKKYIRPLLSVTYSTKADRPSFQVPNIFNERAAHQSRSSRRHPMQAPKLAGDNLKTPVPHGSNASDRDPPTGVSPKTYAQPRRIAIQLRGDIPNSAPSAPDLGCSLHRMCRFVQKCALWRNSRLHTRSPSHQ